MTDMIDINVKLGRRPGGVISIYYVLIPICEIDEVNIGICLLFSSSEHKIIRELSSTEDLANLLNSNNGLYLDVLRNIFNYYAWCYASKNDSMIVFSVTGQKDFDSDFRIRVNFHQSKDWYSESFNMNDVKMEDDVTASYIVRKRSDRNFIKDTDSVRIISTIIKNIKTIKPLRDITRSYLLDNIEKIRLVPDCTQESI